MQLNLQDFSEFSINCQCGESHKLSSKIVVGDIKNLKSNISDFLSGGKILLLLDASSVKIQRQIIDELQNYKIISIVCNNGFSVASLFSLSDDVRIIIGIGEENVAVLTRYFATVKNIKSVVVPLHISAVGLIEDKIKVDICLSPLDFDADSPSLIFIDYNLLNKNYILAESYGHIISKFITLLDLRISEIFTNRKYCKKLYSLSFSAIKNTLEVSPQNSENTEKLFDSNFLLNLCGKFGLSFGYETAFAQVINKKYGKSVWLYEYYSFLYLLEIYGVTFSLKSFKSFDLPDYLKLEKNASDFLGIDHFTLLKNINVPSFEIIEERKIIFEQNREKFLREIGAITTRLCDIQKDFESLNGEKASIPPSEFKKVFCLLSETNDRYSVPDLMRDFSLIECLQNF